MPYWDEIFKEMSGKYPEIKTDQYHIDNLTALFVLHPERFDIVVGSNLFGDIITDLGSMLQGGMGFAAGGNINPEKFTHRCSNPSTAVP
jgi:tartrate dehydrogenase/decarboxylase/D-malate dehydrogenase